MATVNLRVIPRDGAWAVEAEGNVVPLSKHMTQTAAIQAGREEAKKRGCELKIHAADGTFRDADSYGNDPPSSKDKVH